ncbi:MAG TPA: YdeI/OmpD-associated family protein [Planctomycetota bacterium]|nr:YdeI/OmpD-associated family protein [Planctomycetota bacterium]
MGEHSAAVTAYIAKAAPFARPIFEKLRKLFHKACPAIEEKLKWNCPSFEYKGMVGGFAGFKAHAAFGFWRQDVLPDPEGLFKTRGAFGGKLTDVSQLPPDEIILQYIRRAVDLNEKGAPARFKAKPKPPLKVPPYFMTAIRKNKKALATFEKFPPSHKREYVEWVVEAKQDETRRKRLETAVAWMAEGKARHWKYEKC